MEKKEGKRGKKWEKPQMIVLLRGKPEESVLLSCKFDGKDGPSPKKKQHCHPAHQDCAKHTPS
jgi:hypothetical protein